MIAGLDRGHARADRLDHATAFVAEDAGEHSLGIVAREREGVGVTDAGGDDAHQGFAGLGAIDFDVFDLERFARLPGDRGAGFQHFDPGEAARASAPTTCLAKGMVNTIPVARRTRRP